MRWPRWRVHGSPVSATAAGAGGDDRAHRYGADLLAQAREELNRADAKASILLAAVGVALGGVAGGLVGRGWSPLRLPVVIAVVWWAGAAAVSGGITALLAAVYPRRRRRHAAPAGTPGQYVGYYGDVAGLGSVAEVVAAVRRSAPRDVELIAEQLLQISRIVYRKYRLLSLGIWLLATGIACDVAALLINTA